VKDEPDIVIFRKDEEMGTSKILVIDDDPDIRAFVTALLESKQHTVKTAADPDEGFNMLEQEPPDLIIMDVMMGKGAGGFILARKVRKDPRFDAIPIVMLTGMREQTGFSFPHDPKHPKFLPIDEFLEKPIDPEVLMDTVERQLAKTTSS